MRAQTLSCIQLFMAPWTLACQVPLSTGFSRQEHWSGLSFPPSGVPIGKGIYERDMSHNHSSYKRSLKVKLDVLKKDMEGLPWWLSGKESACQVGDAGLIPGSRTWQPTPVFLPRKSHRQRSLAGYSPWGCKKVSE